MGEDDLSFMKQREDDNFGKFFSRLLNGLRKLSSEENEVVSAQMLRKDVTFEDALETARTMLLIQRGKYTPLRRGNK